MPARQGRFSSHSIVLDRILPLHRVVQRLPLTIYSTLKLNVVTADTHDVALRSLRQLLAPVIRSVEVLLLRHAVRVTLLLHAAGRSRLA